MADLKDDLAALRIEREPERSGAGRYVMWGILLAVLAGGGYFGWRYMSQERPIEVEVSTVSERAAGTQAAVLNAAGYVTARRRATVSSKITGKLMFVDVEEGRAVQEGQVLARLDDSSVKAAMALAMAQAEAARHAVHESEVRMAQAKVTLGRMMKLQQDGFGTQADVDLAKAEVDSTQARINMMNEQVSVQERQIALQQTDIDNTVIRAPFSGIAISKDAQAGEMVSPVSAGGGFTRTGICTIVDMSSLEVEVDVNESYLNRVRPAQGVTAVLDAYPDWQIPAHVIAIVPTADRQKATVLVRIGFEHLDPRILPDMGVKVMFLRNAEGAPGAAAAAPLAQAVTLAPKAAIKTVGTDTFAFIVRGDVVERRAVRVGGADGDRVEIVAGLRSGDKVVVSPPANLTDGATIAVRK